MIKGFVVLLLNLVLIVGASFAKKDTTKYSNKERVESDLKTITKTDGYRNHLNLKVLNSVAEYIHTELSKVCDTTYYQVFTVDGKEYKNVIGSIGVEKSNKLIVGAHYDVCGHQEGADDNASGIVGLLELARIISEDSLINNRIDFVAYTLEEPPYYGKNKMGSHFHAKSLHDNGEKIKGMICLEMIGYFSDEKNSQDYPLGFLKLFYGNKGDFITVVQKFGNGRFGRKFKRKMKRQNLIKTKAFKAPAILPGIDFSDHRNYWKFGYSAVMITNTAFYRNKHYHETSDTMERLDLDRMCLVIDEVYLAIKAMKY